MGLAKFLRTRQLCSSRFIKASCATRGYAVAADDGRATVKKPFVEGVKHIIAVASGKGGVGKSTTAVNLAVALANACHQKVDLLNADIYGPSIPTMMKVHGQPEVNKDMKMIPIENHGVKCMSIGFLVDKDAPIVWRGPMVMSAHEKLTRGFDWGDLDILVVDMPPGTGDAQLSISPRLQLSVTMVGLDDSFHAQILGIIENMSSFKCPHCGERSHIFGSEGVRRTADEMAMDFLGEIPLEANIRRTSDEGNPIVLSDPECETSKLFNNLASRIVQRLEELANEQANCPQILI